MFLRGNSLLLKLCTKRSRVLSVVWILMEYACKEQSTRKQVSKTSNQIFGESTLESIPDPPKRPSRNTPQIRVYDPRRLSDMSERYIKEDVGRLNMTKSEIIYLDDSNLAKRIANSCKKWFQKIKA